MPAAPPRLHEPSAGEVPLPCLREDLALLPGPRAPDGSPTWTIHDPARDRYVRIGWQAFEMLARWTLGTAGAVAAAVTAETTARVTAADVEELVHVLRVNDLVTSDEPAEVERLVVRRAARRVGLLRSLLHNYLFFRVPLLRPDRFLAATGWLVAPFFTAAWWWMVVAAGLTGLLLASRQWDAFAAGVAGLVSWERAPALAVTLALVKVLHEFGHAYTARRFGCPVPTMGVAFLVLWPVLYTDTTHAYRLVSRRRRLAIAAGGILAELAVAAFSTLAWALLPEGALRTGCHAAATVSWIGTLAINLNPFMRFDGYYLLADALDVPNLQDRAFALARWWLRERLFGLGEPPPEHFARRLRRVLIAYATATWAYRFAMFLSIALMVYGLAFKLLGILLMLVEIVWFLALPILRELGAWWRRRGQVRPARAAAVLGALTALLAAGSVPWPWPVTAPAVLAPASVAAVHAPWPARVAALHVEAGALVAAGQPVITLDLPDLGFEMEHTERRIAALKGLIERAAAVAEDAQRVGVLRQELETAETMARGFVAQRAALVLRAPLAGQVVDRTEPLAVGQWVRPERRLMRVVALDTARVVGFIAADDLPRVAHGAAARFVGEDPAAPAEALRVVAVDAAAVSALDQPMMASTLGGPLGVVDMPAVTAAGVPGRTVRHPLLPVYRVVLAPTDGGPGMAVRTLRGTVTIDGPPVSLFARLWRASAAVLLRESGF